jgi:hypothetical protein
MRKEELTMKNILNYTFKEGLSGSLSIIPQTTYLMFRLNNFSA